MVNSCSRLLIAAAACSQVAAAFLASSSQYYWWLEGTTDQGRGSPRFVLADLPSLEDEKRKEKKESDKDSWFPSGGGFIPQLSGLTEKVVAKRRSAPNKPLEVVTIHEYKDVVVDEKDKIVAVRFYAPWCKSCKAVERPFRRLMQEYPNVKFVESLVTKENAFLHEGLGVPSFPYGHIYHPDVGLVEELKINKHEFRDFTRILNYYVYGAGDVEYPEDDVCSPKKE